MTAAAGGGAGGGAGTRSTPAAGAGSAADVLVCDFPMPGSRGVRPAAVAELRRLAPDIVVLHDGPSGLRWRSAAAALARDAGLLYLDGGGGSGAPMLFVRMRVDTVTTWIRSAPGTSGRSRGALVGGVLRCSGRLVGVVGARYPAGPADRVRFGETVLAAVGELRGVTETVVVAVGPGGDHDIEGGRVAAVTRQLAGGGLLRGGGGQLSSAVGSASSGLDGIWTTQSVLVLSADPPTGHQGSEHPPRLARLGVPSA